MSKNTAEPDLAQALVELRRARLKGAVGRPLRPFGDGAQPAAPVHAEYLLNEAKELFWNELAWEELTDEEAIGGGHLTELVFPGFLAFIEGLLVERVPADSLAPARPHPDLVEELLVFVAERHVAFTAELEQGADSERIVWARSMTSRLVDLVLSRLYGLSMEELEESGALG
ncbi:hypothetical protein BH23GEM6_BH23GEM6_16970 [soil metagenome]